MVSPLSGVRRIFVVAGVLLLACGGGTACGPKPVGPPDAGPAEPPDAGPPPVEPVTLSVAPATATLAAGASMTFTATVKGSADASVVWSASAGSIDANGRFVAPSSAGTIQVVARSHADPRQSATAEVRVTASALSLSIAPTSATVEADGQLQFTATLQGSASTDFTWSTDLGSINATGLFTAPGSAGTAHVRVRSAAHPSTSAEAVVTVLAPPPPPEVSISLQPGHIDAVAMDPKPYPFRATVTGAEDEGVIWSIEGNPAVGSIDANGVYTPPQRQSISMVEHVVATSRADPSKKAVAVVNVWRDLIDKGGLVTPTLRVYSLWWGDMSLFPADARSVEESFLRGLNGSSYLSIVDQYMRGARASVTFEGSLFEPTPPPDGDPPFDSIVATTCRALEANGIRPRPEVLVLVNSSKETTDYACGWHTMVLCSGDGDAQPVQMTFLPNHSGHCSYNVPVCGTSHSAEAMALVHTVSHELMESMTDPSGNAWEAAGEIADKCGGLACTSLSTGRFLVSPLYSNQVHDCVSQ